MAVTALKFERALRGFSGPLGNSMSVFMQIRHCARNHNRVSVKPGTHPEHPRNTPEHPRNTTGTARNSPEQPRNTPGTSHNTPNIP